MVLRAKTLTPEVLLSAPRRSPAVPNDKGTLAIFSVSTYSFQTKETSKEIRVLDLKSGKSSLLTNDEGAKEAVWIPGSNEIMWLRSGKKGNTHLMIGDGDHPSKESYKMDTIEAPFGDLKLISLADGIACTFSGWADAKGSLYNEVIADKPASTGRIYENLFVRFWDRYIDTAHKQVIWYTKLVRKSGHKWKLAAPVHNALKGTDFESPFPYDPLGGGADSYDISSSGIVFVANNPASEFGHMSSDAYFVSLSSFTEEKAPTPKKLIAADYTGEVSNPRFSPCGRKITFMVNSSSRNQDTRFMLVPDISTSLRAVDLSHSFQEEFLPNGSKWSRDGKSIFVTAERCGRTCLFRFSLTDHIMIPKPLTQEGAVSSFSELGASGKLLVSSSSLIDPSIYSIVDAEAAHEPIVISTASKHGSKLGLSAKQVSEVYFEGGGDYCVQAWVVKPPDFDEKKTYPLAMLFHGGPESSWEDAWSTRWNPACWAAQGYVVVAPNPTGSTGFGLEFTEGIYNSWGGRPYEDLVNCFEYVKENMPFVDTTRAIGAGGSYGGYLANYIQGKPLGREFKCIVSHDSVFNTQMLIAGDSFNDGDEDFAGPILPWKNFKHLEKWNPARPDLLKNWKTPMLIIHSELDYRCIISDGLAAFGVCQAKGVPSKFLNFPDEGHWVLKPENSLLWHKTVFGWINRWSGVTQEAEIEAQMDDLSLRESHISV